MTKQVPKGRCCQHMGRTGESEDEEKVRHVGSAWGQTDHCSGAVYKPHKPCKPCKAYKPCKPHKPCKPCKAYKPYKPCKHYKVLANKAHGACRQRVGPGRFKMTPPALSEEKK